MNDTYIRNPRIGIDSRNRPFGYYYYTPRNPVDRLWRKVRRRIISRNIKTRVIGLLAKWL